MSSRRTTIFVAGINPRTRARDLAYEFERFGRLVRCDIPAPRGTGRPFAFVEFVDPRDAMDAYNDLHGARIDGHVITLQWARTPGRRHDDHYSGGAPPAPRAYDSGRDSDIRPRPSSREPAGGYRDRSRSPVSRGRSRSPVYRSPQRRHLSPYDSGHAPATREIGRTPSPVPYRSATNPPSPEHLETMSLKSPSRRSSEGHLSHASHENEQHTLVNGNVADE